MALIDNMMQQVTPVVVVGSQTASGGFIAGAGSSQQQYGTVTNTLITSNGGSFTIPAGGKALIQCWDDEPVFVKFGPNVTTTDCSIILSAGTSANDGKGGSYMIDDYTGIVTVTAATAVRVNVAIFS